MGLSVKIFGEEKREREREWHCKIKLNKMVKKKKKMEHIKKKLYLKFHLYFRYGCNLNCVTFRIWESQP